MTLDDLDEYLYKGSFHPVGSSIGVGPGYLINIMDYCSKNRCFDNDDKEEYISTDINLIFVYSAVDKRK